MHRTFDPSRFMYSTAEGSGTPAPSQQPQPAPAGEEWKAMDKDAFNARLQREREAGTKETLKTLGVKDVGELQQRLAKAKELEDAQKTELQKLQERATQLETTAGKATAYESAVKELLAAEEEAIPEDKRGILDLAPAADDPAARLKWIANAKKKGLFGGAPAQQAKPAATTGAAPGPKAPAPVAQPGNLYEKWKAMPDGFSKAAFYSQNRGAIEAARPKQQ